MKSLLLSFLFTSSLFIGLNAQKTIPFTFTETAPVVDGLLSDIVWNDCQGINTFYQQDPLWGSTPTQKTEVKICYTNHGIFIGAMMYDNAPDSILHEYGMRDNTVNADYFAIEFDPYNTMQDSYYFQVTASGVQSEWRRTDGYYNAVWKSAVKIFEKGWSAEVFIPFSAFTFPSKDIQNWRVQLNRYIRRNRELDILALENKTNDNDIQYWAISENLKSIKSPLRLFLNPYLNEVIEKRVTDASWSNKINGGLDLKWGVNQSYTIDVTLLPDFSQVQSDNKVKNLSAFETVYGDYRPFFYESMSLFKMGDLIYSRRIAGTPTGYYDVENKLDSGERVVENPFNTQLINAVKFYGRSTNGLAVGFFNAITKKSEAVVEQSNGERRFIETQPLTNYNILVIDKALKGKSNLFFSNANTYRGKTNLNANVAAFGGNYYFSKGTYRIYLLSGMSRRVEGDNFYAKTNMEGYKTDFLFAKVNGKFQYQTNIWLKDKNYDPNDMGVNFVNNEISTFYQVSYREPDPFGKVLSMKNSLSMNYATRWTTGMPTTFVFNYNFNTTTKRYISLWGGLGWRPANIYDYYEPRNGQFFKGPRFVSGNANFSTDYRKPFACDGAYSVTYVYDYFGINHFFNISPIARIGNHLNIRYNVWYTNNIAQRGFAFVDENTDESFFGKRHVQTVENSLSAQYVVINNLSFGLSTRYYWSKGDYSEFYLLHQDGILDRNPAQVTQNKNFTYSAFNIDFSINWDFAPGSSLVLTYKNELVHELTNADKNYMQYLRYSLDNPFSNLIALKIIYFIDAGRVVKRK